MSLGGSSIAPVAKDGLTRICQYTFRHRRANTPCFQMENRQELKFCRNCSAPLTGPFCSKCGQEDIDYNRAFKIIVRDLFYSFANFGKCCNFAGMVG